MRQIAVLLLFPLAWGCGDAPVAPPPDDVPDDVYVLASINGKSLPAAVSVLYDAGVSTVTASRITLRHDGTYGESIEFRLSRGELACTCPPSSTTAEGSYTLTGTELTLHSTELTSRYGTVAGARVEANQLVLTLPVLDQMVAGPDELVFMKE